MDSLEKYGSLPGISSGTFEFKRLLIKDLITKIKSDIQYTLNLPYYQSLKKEFESAQTTAAIKKMVPSNQQNNIATRSSNRAIVDFNIPQKGPKECRAFSAWEEIGSRMQEIEKSYDETLEIVDEKKKKVAPNNHSNNPFNEPQTVIQDLQALSIQDYITDFAFIISHGFLELPSNLQKDKLANVQLDKGKETVNQCYLLLESQVASLRLFQAKVVEITSWKYLLTEPSAIKAFYTKFEESNSSRKFITFTIKQDDDDENYKADKRSAIIKEVPIKGAFSISFDSINSIEDLRAFYDELQGIIQDYQSNFSDLKSTDQNYQKFVALKDGINNFLEEYAKNKIGNNSLQTELEDRSKQVELLKMQKKRMQHEYQAIHDEALNELKEIERNNEELSEKNETLARNVTDSENKISEAQKESQLINEKLEAHEQRLDTLQTIVKQFVTKQLEYIKSMKEKLDQSKKEADEILHKWEDKKHARENDEPDLNSDTIKKLKDTITSLRSSLIESLNLLESLTTDFDDASTQEITKLKEDIEDVQNTIQQLEKMLVELKSENQQLKAEISELKETIESLKRKNVAVIEWFQRDGPLTDDENFDSTTDGTQQDEISPLLASKPEQKKQKDYMLSKEYQMSLVKNEAGCRTKNKIMACVFWLLEGGLLVAYSQPTNFYSTTFKMSDKTINIFKGGVIIAASVMLLVYLGIKNKSQIRHCLATAYRFFKPSENKKSDLSNDPTLESVSPCDDSHYNLKSVQS